jgi:hypothetical protein
VTVLTALSLSAAGQDAEQEPRQAPEASPPEEPRPAPRDNRPLDEIFIPSEEIAADEEVTFPVDI